MNSEDRSRLINDLQENGYNDKHPIILYEGEILDGWNRYRACQELDIEPTYEKFNGSREEAFDYVLQSNKRRNLTSSQWAAIAVESEDIYESIADEVERQRIENIKNNVRNQYSDEGSGKKLPNPKNYDDTKTSTRVANAFNTNRTYVNESKKIKQEDPDTFEKIKSGETNFSQIKKEKKRQKLEQKKKEIKQKEKKEITYTPIAYDQSYQEYLINTDKRFDLLLTDPPFSTDIDNIAEFVNNWLPLALATLTDTARGYICIGAYPEEIEAYFKYFNNQDRFITDSPLIWTYRNTLGRTPKRKYNLNYQLILHFYSEDSEDLDTSITNEMFSVQDINAPDGRQGDRFHKWQKPNKLAQRLIRHSTREGDQIVDPFCGSGTFLVNAGKLNRYGFGCDIDKEALKIAKERGCDVQR
ncbi:MAG TPA: DNA modification methylase [Bacteroidales bacterium]|nr:DNA modification methylase [Bacteroidales bacterium]